jgi:hypothetical protein
MPSINLSPRLMAWFIAVAVAGCAGLSPLPPPQDYSRLPRQIRSGAADMVIQPVERDVSPDEVNSAVSRIVSSSPICMTWPSLWLEDVHARSTFRARYDLMKRDWGMPVALASQQRMDEFVDMGFVTKRARDDVGADVVEYTLTDLGRNYLNGSPYGGDRPNFCAPSERRVVAVTRMDFGQFPCGSLQVHFMHAAPAAPSWARTEAARARVAQSIDALPAGMTNGSLQSACYDTGHKNIIGNDLNLNVGGGS